MKLNSRTIAFSGLLILAIVFQNCGAFKATKTLNPLDADGSFDGSSNNPAMACQSTKLDHTTIRKLNNLELNNSVNDLLGLNINVTVDLPSDTASAEGFTNNGDFLKTTDQFLTLLMPAIEFALSSAVTANSKAFVCPTANKDAACAQSLIQSFANRAYRKKIANADLTALVSFFNSIKTSGANFEDSLSAVYERILLSPNFLIRTASQGGVAIDGVVPLSNYEIASRLSFFLWNSIPDDALIEAASKGEILSEAMLRAQIDRMLKDPKTKRFTDIFTSQWLGIDRVLSPNSVARTDLTDQLRQDMVTESKLFVNYVLTNGKSVQDLVGGEYSFLNQNLATLYGIPNVTGSNFRLVDLKGSTRRGLLTQGAFLTLMAKVSETAPIGRGNKILQLITCSPPPAFDGGEGVTELAQNNDPNVTIRERMEVHRADPKCAGCHAQMDPIGLGLEGFDFIGRPRLTYSNGRTIATEGVLLSKPFKDSAELLGIINSQTEYKRCISKNMMVYAIGRAATMNDLCVMQQIGSIAVQPNKTFTDLVLSIVMSQQFRFNSVN